MKSRRAKTASKVATLPSRPPRAVNVRSAEGYVGRLPGLGRRMAPKITEAEANSVLRGADSRPK
jgi:hypothetical protein